MHEAFYAYLESVLGTLRGTNVPTKTNAQVASSTSSHAGKRGEKLQLCSFYMKGKGCNRGKDCRYMHDPSELPQHACYQCGRLNHVSRDCNVVPKEKQSFMKVQRSTQKAAAKPGASKIDASEEQNRPEPNKAEVKFKSLDCTEERTLLLRSQWSGGA